MLLKRSGFLASQRSTPSPAVAGSGTPAALLLQTAHDQKQKTSPRRPSTGVPGPTDPLVTRLCIHVSVYIGANPGTP